MSLEPNKTGLKLYLVQGGARQWTMQCMVDAAEHPQNRERLKILLSYWYYRQTDLERVFEKYFEEPWPDVWADSGAFSAMTKGVTITCEEYAAWIKRWAHLFTHYSNLDVITNAEATWENQQTLEGMGLQPVPTFHVLEEWEWLEHYLDRYNYIALGVAGQQQRTQSVMKWLIRCFEMAGDRAVYHGFALTSWHIMKSFPWYSVDSSSWGQGFRYGVVPFLTGAKGGLSSYTWAMPKSGPCITRSLPAWGSTGETLLTGKETNGPRFARSLPWAICRLNNGCVAYMDPSTFRIGLTWSQGS